ncbi:MAG: HWE histidine kinase domain-containing protein [Sphingomonadales bacterium]|jgi:PAS domain S-box-containing protein
MIEDRLSAAPHTPARTRTAAVQRPLFAGDLPLPGRIVRQAVLEGLPQMLWTATADGHIDFHNERCRAFLGLGPDGKARHWTAPVHPADLSAALDLWRRSMADRSLFDTELRLRRHDGAWRWVACRIAPDRGPDGTLRGWTGCLTDIDDFKRAAERGSLIAAEAAHRLRNIYSVVGALLMLSARTAPEAREFANAARDRLAALARAHDLATTGAGGGSCRTGLHALLETLLAPCQTAADPPAITVSGPDVPVSGDAVMALALVVQELASNALRHGALSQPTGGIRIRTEIAGADLLLSWQELGGPPLAGPPQRQGFGTMLFDRAVPGLAGARFTRDWPCGGMVARLSVPLAALAA